MHLVFFAAVVDRNGVESADWKPGAGTPAGEAGWHCVVDKTSTFGCPSVGFFIERDHCSSR